MITFHVNGKNAGDKSFNIFNDALSFLKKIRDGNMMLEKSKKIKMSIHQI